MTIDRASLADAGSLARLHHETVSHAYRHIFGPDSQPPPADSLEDGWRDLLTADGCTVYMTRRKARIVGSVAVLPDNSLASGLLLKRLHVHPNEWGQGIGSELHDHALLDVTQRGAEYVNLWVLEANSRARGMYERRGWALQPGRTLPNDPPSIIDILYQLHLAKRA